MQFKEVEMGNFLLHVQNYGSNDKGRWKRTIWNSLSVLQMQRMQHIGETSAIPALEMDIILAFKGKNNTEEYYLLADLILISSS